MGALVEQHLLQEPVSEHPAPVDCVDGDAVGAPAHARAEEFVAVVHVDVREAGHHDEGQSPERRRERLDLELRGLGASELGVHLELDLAGCLAGRRSTRSPLVVYLEQVRVDRHPTSRSGGRGRSAQRARCTGCRSATSSRPQ